jgi:hypothetical protein
VVGSCDCGNEPPFSIKCGEFPDWLNYCCLLEKDFAQWPELVMLQTVPFAVLLQHLIS